MSSVRTILHVLAAVHFWFGCYYDWHYVKVPADVHKMGQTFGPSGKLRFLTFWDALLQAAFFTICALNDLIGSNDDNIKEKPLIRKMKDQLLTCLAFPLAMFVGVTFWAIYAVDRELVFPKVLDEFFPVWLNHVMHTNIIIFILIELATSFREYPSRKTGLTILTTFMIIYLVWVHVIHAYSGAWVYPILEVLNLPMRIVFFIASLCLSVGLYLLGEMVNNLIWSSKLKEIEQKHKRAY